MKGSDKQPLPSIADLVRVGYLHVNKQPADMVILPLVQLYLCICFFDGGLSLPV